MQDKGRKTGRIRVKIEAKYRLLDRDDWHSCEIQDVGSGGLSIVGKQSFVKGDIMELQFRLAKRYISTQAEVTHVAGRRAGVKFHLIHKNEQDFIREYTNSHLVVGKALLR